MVEKVEKLARIVFLTVGLAAVVILMAQVFYQPWAPSTHTHAVTGVQDGAVVCVDGWGAVDYNMFTERPMLLCGVIEVREEEPPTLQPHFTQP